MPPLIKKRSGRPRSAEIDRAVLEAVCKLLAEKGYVATSIEMIAHRAGVGKAAIYRRWSSKEDLVVELLSHVATRIEPVPDLGDTRAELLRMVGETVEMFSRTSVGGIIRGLASELSRNARLRRLVREQVIGLRRSELEKVLKRGIARGELRADTYVEIAHELLTGPAYHRLLLGGLPLDKQFAESIVDAFLRGARAD
ncbi:MAG: TetR/AcrR family transcriptional regulator [Gaiellaceae bacterium]